VGRGEPNCPLTGASEAVRRPGYGGEGGGGRNSSAGHAQAQRVGNGEGMSAVRRGRAPRPLMAIQFGGEGKRRGEWGVKRGVAVAISGGEGMPEWRQRAREVAAVAPDQAFEEKRRADG
jgi:hypothetical protein